MGIEILFILFLFLFLIIGVPLLYFLIVGYVVNEMKEFGGLIIICAFLFPPVIIIIWLSILIQKNIERM